MWLHRIQLNIDHPEARRDVADVYQMHRTLTRAFVDGPTDKPRSFLWRLEDSGNNYGVVLIQSADRGDFRNIDDGTRGYLRSVEYKEFTPETSIKNGAIYHFRLRANPSVSRAGKRHALIHEDEQIEWLQRQGGKAGFELRRCICGGTHRIQMRKKSDNGQTITIGAVTFDGALRVTDVPSIARAMTVGIGHAKSFGLGLLSLARGELHGDH